MQQEVLPSLLRFSLKITTSTKQNMGSSVQNLLKRRKHTQSYLLYFSLFILLILSSLLFVLNTSQSPLNLTSDVEAVPPNAPLLTQVEDVEWRICHGVLAVDYIPCLDNFKAIRALKERRRMQRKERHCPHPSPRCLVPLPHGYRLPVPWPKSRDMVRFNDLWHILVWYHCRLTFFNHFIAYMS